MPTLAPSSPPPSAVCLTHLHLECFIILQLLLPFLIVVIATGGLMDHVEEVGVTNVEAVVSAEGAPPVLERHSQDFVCEGPLQAHELGLPSHLQLDGFLLLVAVHYLEVHWHVLRLAQKKIDEKDDTSNLRHRYVLHLTRVLTRYFALRWYFFRITAKLLGSMMGRES